jgi:hypothetical protein
MNIPRRTFLAQAGTAMAGLSALASQEARPALEPGKGVPPSPPKPLADALARARAENKPVILLRIPEDPEARHRPGHVVIYLVNAETEETPEVLSEVILICVESPTIREHVPGAAPMHAVILLDAEGKARDGKPFDFTDGWAALPGTIRTLAHGSDGLRLKNRAATIRQKTDPQVLAALERLGTGEAKPEDKAALTLEAPKIIPLIVQSKLEASTKARQQALRDLIETYYRSALQTSPGPQLPFGVDTVPFVPSCGKDHCKEQAPEALERRASVACGMAVAMPNARMFLRYLTR